MGRFDGKSVIVTGAGQGAGRKACILMAREGASVLVVDDDAAAAESSLAAIRGHGGAGLMHCADVSTAGGAEGVVARAVEEYGGLDILVNARMAAQDLPILNMTSLDFDATVRHNLKGAFMPTRSASVQFRQQRSGRIVSITSDAGRGSAGQAGLAAASEGIIGMTRTAARDLGRYGVTCNVISVSDGGSRTSEGAASLAAVLCLDAASHVNGIVFGVDEARAWTYSNPAILRSFHTWGGFTMDEMDSLFPALLHGDETTASHRTLRISSP